MLHQPLFCWTFCHMKRLLPFCSISSAFEMVWYESSPRYWFRFRYQTRKLTFLFPDSPWPHWEHDPMDAPYMFCQPPHPYWIEWLYINYSEVITSPSLAAPGIDGSFLSQGLWSSQEDLWTQQPQAVPGEMCLTWHFGDENGRCGNCPENRDKRGCFVF